MSLHSRGRASGVLVATLAVLVALLWSAGPASARDNRVPVLRVSVNVFAPTATVARASAVSVSVNRGRIVSLELDTDGLTADDDWTISGRTVSGSVTWHSVGTGRITVKVTLASGRVLSGTAKIPVAADATIDASLPRYQLVYVYPADGNPVEGRARAIAHEATVVDAWFASQLGGVSPRFSLDLVGEPSVVTLAAPLGAAALSKSSDVAADLVTRWRAEGVIAANTIPIVYVDAMQTKLPTACGWYETPVDLIVLPLGNCSIEPSERAVFPYRSTAILAHEIVHSLGALSDAPAKPDGSGRHTTDDPSDLMYDGPQAHDWQNLTLDPGKDDYLSDAGGSSDTSSNIEKSPLLEGGGEGGGEDDAEDSGSSSGGSNGGGGSNSGSGSSNGHSSHHGDENDDNDDNDESHHVHVSGSESGEDD